MENVIVKLQIFLGGGIEMLQERINELDSAILNVVGDWVYTLGFYNTERLNSFLDKGKKNWSSTGRYPFEELVFHNIKTHATIILQYDGGDVARYQYINVKNGVLVYDNVLNKSGKATGVYEIRKEVYSSTWNLRFADNSLVFAVWGDMRNYVLTTYNYDIGDELLMERKLLLDIETGGFQVEDEIYEVAVLAIENGEIVASLHLGEVLNENEIHDGMGAGYACISENEHYISKFQSFVTKYPYPFVAHNASFDRKFLVHYGWISEEATFYDSVRAIKRECPHLFGYSLDYLVNYFGIERGNAHTAIDDVHVLFKVLEAAQPNQWLPLYKASPNAFKSSAKSFLERGLKLKGESEAFKGKHLVFTGASQFPRVLMQEIAVGCGATVGNSVIKKTDYLICGEKVGANKISKAIELDVPMYEDNWFIDIVFQDLAIEESEHKPIESSNNFELPQYSSNQSPYKLLSEFEGRKVNIACLKWRVQGIVSDLLGKMGAIVVASPSAKKVDYMIYTDNGEYKLLEQSEELGIISIPVSRFNRMVLEGEKVCSH